MKNCSLCQEMKNDSDFYSTKKGKLFSQCKLCIRKRYINNKREYLSRAYRSRENVRHWYIEYKKTLCCDKCNESRWYLLDFHHFNFAQKDSNVADLLCHNSIEKLKEELSKCVPLCSNCHREIHYFETLEKENHILEGSTEIGYRPCLENKSSSE